MFFTAIDEYENKAATEKELLPMTRDFLCDLVGVTALATTTVVTLWLPAILQA